MFLNPLWKLGNHTETCLRGRPRRRAPLIRSPSHLKSVLQQAAITSLSPALDLITMADNPSRPVQKLQKLLSNPSNSLNNLSASDSKATQSSPPTLRRLRSVGNLFSCRTISNIPERTHTPLKSPPDQISYHGTPPIMSDDRDSKGFQSASDFLAPQNAAHAMIQTRKEHRNFTIQHNVPVRQASLPTDRSASKESTSQPSEKLRKGSAPILNSQNYRDLSSTRASSLTSANLQSLEIPSSEFPPRIYPSSSVYSDDDHPDEVLIYFELEFPACPRSTSGAVGISPSTHRLVSPEIPLYCLTTSSLSDFTALLMDTFNAHIQKMGVKEYKYLPSDIANDGLTVRWPNSDNPDGQRRPRHRFSKVEKAFPGFAPEILVGDRTGRREGLLREHGEVLRWLGRSRAQETLTVRIRRPMGKRWIQSLEEEHSLEAETYEGFMIGGL